MRYLTHAVDARSRNGKGLIQALLAADAELEAADRGISMANGNYQKFSLHFKLTFSHNQLIIYRPQYFIK